MIWDLMTQWLKNTWSAGDTGDVGLILGQEDPPEEAVVTHSNIRVWKVP